MNDIPNLGEFGYIPAPVLKKEFDWLSIIVYGTIVIMILYFVYKYLERFLTKIERVHKKIEVPINLRP